MIAKEKTTLPFIPTDITVNEDEFGYNWFDEDGIYVSCSKPNAPGPDLKALKESEQKWLKSHGDKKICWLCHINEIQPSPKEVRDYMAEILPKYIKALAMVSKSPLGRMAANIFFRIKSQPYPVKMFPDQDTAKTWLRQYL
ncbi:MAG: hypothetical protein ACPF8V_03360 [Luteibaculum sp.]